MARGGVQGYLLSVPERVLRSASALAAGLVREAGQAALPPRVRRTRLYRSMVEATLRFLIEDVGQVEGVYPREGQLPSDFFLRATAGTGIAWTGLLTFHFSPVWVVGALADVSGAGRDLVAEVADALKQEGLLDTATPFESIDQILDGLERSAGRVAQTLNAPPLDVAALRAEWAAFRGEARRIPPRNLPSVETIRRSWEQLKEEAANQGRPVFLVSSLMAVSAVARIPESLLWLSRCAHAAARRASLVLAGTLLDHYAATLLEIHQTGYLDYWIREYRPYLFAAARQFSPSTRSLTQRLLP